MPHQQGTAGLTSPRVQDFTRDGDQMADLAALVFKIQLHFVLFILGGQWIWVIRDGVASLYYYMPMAFSAAVALRISYSVPLFSIFEGTFTWHRAERASVPSGFYRLGFLFSPAFTFTLSSALTAANCSFAIASQHMSGHQASAVVLLLCITYGVAFVFCVSFMVACTPLEDCFNQPPFLPVDAIMWLSFAMAVFHLPTILTFFI